ncbi:MAG: hypothetical protein EOM25_10320 [Deltaproteobacteria bacterium]|nr:hypothetical protein [Deltaproteobacteria bacterium]
MAKLVAATGALEGNTFLGGSGEDFGYGIALDGSGNIYVTGESDATWGDPHRVFSGSTDAFVAMLSGEAGDGLLDLQGNGFLGGSGEDSGNGIALDEGGSIFVVGTSSDSWGTPSRPHAGNYDAFVLRLNGETAALEALAFLGGSGDDYGRGIALDDTGNVYVTGESSATWGSPIREFSGDTDAFTAKFNSASGAVVWNAFLGGTGTDSGSGLTTSGVGTVYVTGYGDSSWGNPVRGYTADGFYDCFVAKVVKQGGLAGVLMLLLGE